jgi:DNA-binding IclR family transcriptional regulator
MAHEQPVRPRTVAGKVMAILETFADSNARLSLTEICRRSGLPLGTGHRLVGELTRACFLERLPGGSYRVGTRLWRIGAQPSAVSGLRELALPHMEDLYEGTHENVQLAVLRDGKALYIERIRGARSVPIVTRVGAELPLHATAVGKVLLAYAPEDLCAEIIGAGLAAHTAYTMTDPDVLRACLVQVHRNGFAVTKEEMTLGTSSVAAPVTDVDHQVVAALSVVARSRGTDPRHLLPAVVTGARALSRDVAAYWVPEGS